MECGFVTVCYVAGVGDGSCEGGGSLWSSIDVHPLCLHNICLRAVMTCNDDEDQFTCGKSSQAN